MKENEYTLRGFGRGELELTLNSLWIQFLMKKQMFSKATYDGDSKILVLVRHGREKEYGFDI